jgi:ferrous-iron efflux pump FieF
VKFRAAGAPPPAPAEARLAPEARDRARTRAALASVLIATTLTALKLVAGLITGSLSLLASAVDSLTDIFASAVNFIAIRAASRPADEDHAYGHEKAESLAGLFQGAVITLSGLYLGYESIRRMIEPRPVEGATIGVGVMVVSAGATIWLVRYLRRVARQTESLALAADSLHYSTDVIVNIGILVALAIIRLTGWTLIDPLLSLGISAYIVYAAMGVIREAIDNLMDHSLPEELLDRVREIALSHPDVQGVHDLLTRSAGPRRFIEMHLEIDGQKSLYEAHEAAVAVLRAVEDEIPNSKVFVHTDPV